MGSKGIFLWTAGLIAIFSGCTQRDKKGRILDNPTQGAITITIDESLRPLMEAELDTFHGSYKYATVKPVYTSESEAIDALLKDSVRMAIVTRKLTPAEMEVFNQVKIIPDQVKIAKDGIALILNRSNTDSVFQFSQIQQIISGKITDWKQIDPSSKLGLIEIVLDNPHSGMTRFINDSIQEFKKLPPNFYAVDNNTAVIDYVSKKPNAIGLIGAFWIGDRDDDAVNKFLGNIRVARVARNGKAVQPFQGYIADGEYPLRRDIYMISREARMGLASGFISFVAGNKGQLVVLKSGMVPATIPPRLVEFK